MDQQVFILLFSGLTAIAALGSAFAAYFGPIRAASAAILLQKTESEAQFKRQIFQTLMANRRTLWVKSAADSLNLIDVVWHDQVEIRDAWADLYRSLKEDGDNQQSAAADRMLKLIARDIGMSGSLRADDWSRFYENGLQWRALYAQKLRDDAVIDEFARREKDPQ